MAAAFAVAHRVQRRQHLPAEAPGLLQQLADQLRRRLGEPRQVGEALEAQDLVQQEQMLLDRRLVAHGLSPSNAMRLFWSTPQAPTSPFGL